MSDGMGRRRVAGGVLAVLAVAGACNLGAAPATTTTTTVAVTTTLTTAPGTTTTTEPLGERRQYGGEVLIGESEEPPTLNFYAPGGDSFIVSNIRHGYWAAVH